MSDEGEIDNLQRDIADVKSTIRELRLRLRGLDNDSFERQGIIDALEHQRRALEIFEESLHAHGQQMVERYSTIMPKTASTFPIVNILESLHARISALEQSQV